MSTFFHSAAMSLLSRTLQTLLSKYLSDVDVEGVALPSAFTDSGWGVRLSNVKLREGTKLIDLPGKSSRRRPRQPRRRPDNKQTRDRSSQQSRKQNDEIGDPSSNNDIEETVDGSSLQTKKKNDEEEAASASASASAGGVANNHLELHTVSTENETDDAESAVAKTAAVDPPRRKSSWLSSWYYGSSSCTTSRDDNISRIREEGTDEEEDEGSSKSLYNGSEEHDIACSSSSSLQDEQHITSNGDDIQQRQRRRDTVAAAAVACPPTSESIDPLIGEHVAQQDDDDTSWNPRDEIRTHPEDLSEIYLHGTSKDDGESKDENAEQAEPPLILRLGRGGRIGTLDVRLVGKTIHILVEDADLTVEVVRCSPANNQGAQEFNDEEAAAATAPSPAKKPVPEPKTTGDRVLAENVISRIVANLPNLFLRDIRLRVVIRDEIVHEPAEDAPLDPTDFQYGSTDTVIDLAIELLSVTDGSDFLLNFGATMESDEFSGSSSDGEMEENPNGDGIGATLSSEGPNDSTTNEFLTKRIRTGRGPEGGILLKIYEVGDSICSVGTQNGRHVWAYDSWRASAQHVVLRCSGVDTQARIFLGTKKEIAISQNRWYEEDAYDYADVDAMIFGGVDYIAPGPQPPLPPYSNPPVSNISNEETWADPGATTFVTDVNGIQSCGLPSPFHKVARGLEPRYCESTHLPCEYCHRCWTKDCGTAGSHALDSSTPLGGLVLHLSVRDPVEANVDRYTLDIIGELISLFSKRVPPAKGGDDDSAAVVDDYSENSIPIHSQRSSRSYVSAVGSTGLESDTVSKNMERSISLDESTRRKKHSQPKRSLSTPVIQSKKYQEFDSGEAFPSYMQPEKITMLGVYIAELRFRVHVLRTAREREVGLSFCYWDILAKCVTLDHQMLVAPERPFHDSRLDVGLLKVSEYKGVERKLLISLGVKQPNVNLDEMTVETFMTAERNHKRSSWPTTAAVMIDVPPPLESLVYEDRSRHGLQLRFMSVCDTTRDVCDRRKQAAIIRLGATIADMPFVFIKETIRDLIREAILSVLGPPKPSADKPDKKPSKSVMTYKVTVEGGRVRLFPIVQAAFPLTTVTGEISTDTGFSLDAIIEQYSVSVGREKAGKRALASGLSLQQLADLPENIRLRVLLFLRDLKPLETALGLQPTKNTFLRCRAVNKGIIKMAKEVASRNFADQTETTSSQERREALVNELLMLDDEALVHLLNTHRREEQRGSEANRP